MERAWWGRNAATTGSRGGSASAHLRKVRRKCGKTAHLRKVERTWWREKRSYSRLSWGLCFYAPSEGEAKMRKNCALVEGETQLQQALVGVPLLRTFGRWDENAAKLHTFGRWDGHGGGRNAVTAGSRGRSASAHLRKVRRKCGKTAHLRKVGRAWWREKRSYSSYSRLSWGSASAHLRKVRRKCGKIAHLRKVGRKCGKIAHLRKVSRLTNVNFCGCPETLCIFAVRYHGSMQ